MEKEKKISFDLKRRKYMKVKTGRDDEAEINETVKVGKM